MKNANINTREVVGVYFTLLHKVEDLVTAFSRSCRGNGTRPDIKVSNNGDSGKDCCQHHSLFYWRHKIFFSVPPLKDNEKVVYILSIRTT